MYKRQVLVYASRYGNTENAIDVIANKLAERGVENIRVYDVSKTHPSYIIGDIFQFSHVVLGAPSYNGGVYFGMETLLHELAALNMQNRKISFVGNGSWAPIAGGQMKKMVEQMKKMEIIGEPVEIRSALKEEQLGEVDALVDAICASMDKA